MVMFVLAMRYHVLVVAEGKHFGLSTACLYVHLAGELRETGVKEMPRGEYETEFEVSVINLPIIHTYIYT